MQCQLKMFKMPTVFNVTVLPPVFGPVITKVLKLFPREISIGTTLSLSIRGCLADFNEKDYQQRFVNYY